jgi:aquaporin Z
VSRSLNPRHWPEYLCEAFGLGLFMVSACGFGVLLFHPASPVVHRVPAMLPRSIAMGTAMGLTAIINIYSPWGRRSGAHLNPAVTLTFYRLGKVAPGDLLGYIGAQFAGGFLGMGAGVLFFRPWVGDPSVNYVATLPGPLGPGVAFLAEFAISFLLILVILNVASRPKLARYTGLVAGTMIALYIALEAPLSGMSMNPARTVGSAAWAGRWTGLWLYFAAPLLGMLGAAQLFVATGDARRRYCAKLHHDERVRCIFCEHHTR